MAGPRRKLLIVGWDGASWDVIRPMMARGELPHLTSLFTNGAHGTLRSTTPPSSAVAWPTFMTGRDPQNHGLWGFYQTVPGSYRPRLIDSRDLIDSSFWDWLGQAGLQTGAVNIPLTYPPRPINGFMVSGMLTPGPEETFAYPVELGEELRAGPPAYPIEAQVMRQIRASLPSLSAALQLLDRWTTDFHAVVRHLLSTRSWDCFVVVYRATDIVQHLLGFQGNYDLSAQFDCTSEVEGGIQAVYGQLDRCLGELLSIVPPETTTFVLSDHGFGPIAGRFYLNNWLHSQGYLSLKRGSQYRRLLGGTRPVPLRRMLTRLGLKGLASRLPSWLTDAAIPVPDRHRFDHLLDWSRTRAYAPLYGSPHAALVRLNLAGRDPLGTVQHGAQAEDLLAELARRLQEISTPEGKPLFREVEVASCDPAEMLSRQGPDLTALPNQENHHPALPTITPDGRLFAPPGLHAAAQHRMDGIFVANGPTIAPQTILEGARLVDIAPTVLYLMGLPVPAEMDGQVLTAAFRPEWQTTHPPRATLETIDRSFLESMPGYSRQDQKRLEDSLRDLGYLG